MTRAEGQGGDTDSIPTSKTHQSLAEGHSWDVVIPLALALLAEHSGILKKSCQAQKGRKIQVVGSFQSTVQVSKVRYVRGEGPDSTCSLGW